MKTLYDKIFELHQVQDYGDGTSLLYIDRHLVHEVTSPQAFEQIEQKNRKLWNKDSILATCDHNVPTENRGKPIQDPASQLQVSVLDDNCRKFNLNYFNLSDHRQGIVHVVGPEQGFTLPGTTLVCGDSHTATHGAFGALAFGIGTSEIEQVLATQTLRIKKSLNYRILVDGILSPYVSAKDIILAIIAKIGISGGTGAVLEYTGPVIDALSMEERMTLCNMSIEAGARAGLIAPDEKTLAFIKGRPMAPKGELFDQAAAFWLTLKSDPDARFDKEVHVNASEIAPYVTWGTNPEMGAPITQSVPYKKDYAQGDSGLEASFDRALNYMDLQEGQPLEGTEINQVFLGSCTNGRLSDIKEAAEILKAFPGRKIASNVKRALIVPGSGLVKAQAEQEGLHTLFINAGFQWRSPGCSMCLGMNEDKMDAFERCASTSNRNFEGRQGKNSRTHLMSPAMVAAAALTGKITDVRKLMHSS